MDRPRTRTRRNFQPLERDGRVAGFSTRANTGALASSAWLAARALFPSAPHWSIEITLRAGDEATFTLELFGQEWGFSLHRADQMSWIRVTDVAFVHGRDDFALLRKTPRLDAIHKLLADIERDFAVTFDRSRPQITSTFGHEDEIATWVRSL